MGVTLMWGDQVLDVKELEVVTAFEPAEEGADRSVMQMGTAEMTFTVKLTFWKLMYLANAIEPQNPKKAKRLRNAADRHNPLRILGLL